MSGIGENPAERLQGSKLANDWVVGNKLATGQRSGNDATGGFFSVSYEAINGKKRAFLKAFDIIQPIKLAIANNELFTTELMQQLQAFEFEAHLHTLCASKKMKRIVRILDYGQTSVTPLPGEQISTVPYMIMELADGGDVRCYIQQSKNIDYAIKLTYLRDIASGLLQLHRAQIAHQDIKPSNVMIFNEDGAKIGDLGRASQQDIASRHDAFPIAGDRTYAPPEQIYRYPLNEWFDRRERCDIYQFGSLACFLFYGVTINSLMIKYIPVKARPLEWGGENSSYEYEESLPHLLEAFNKALIDIEPQLPTWLSHELIEIIRQCSTPDFRERGSKRTIKRNPPNLGIDRFVSDFDRLTHKANIEMRKLSSTASSK
jgi:serine/threonine protein kinase